MPFQSEKQRKYLWANEPEIAKRWEKYPKGYNTGGVSHLFRSKSAKGGYIRPEDSGVLGLAEGGRTGFFRGAQADTASGKSMSPGTSASGGTRSGGDGGYQDVHQTGAVTQTPGRRTAPGEKSGPGYISPEDLRTLEIKEIITRGEEEKGGPEYYGQKKTLVDQQNLENKTNEYILRNLQKLDPTKYYEDMNAFKKFIEIGKSIPKPTMLGLLKAMYDEHKLTSEGKAILDEWKQYVGGPPGSNPEAYDALWLALEKRKSKYRYDEDPEPDGDITTTTIAEDVSGYPSREEMMLAAQRAYEMLYGDKGSTQIPEDTSKRDAYLAAFRQKYLMGDTESVAQGGRVPQGYNTGGLSNLFRLKNK